MRKGFTLLEALVYAAILGSFLIGVFSIFALGARSFHSGVGQLDLHSDLRRIRSSLLRDGENSSYQSMTCVPRTVAGSQRDGFCLAGLNPDGNHHCDPSTGLPLWDSYLIYFATLEFPTGSLARVLVENPELPSIFARPLGDLFQQQSEYLVYPKSRNVLGQQRKLLCHSLSSFQLAFSEADQTVEISLMLQGRSGGGRNLEILESKILLRPGNSWPKL